MGIQLVMIAAALHARVGRKLLDFILSFPFSLLVFVVILAVAVKSTLSKT